MSTATQTQGKKYRSNPIGILNLQPGGKTWQTPEKLRTVHASARLSPDAKERLKNLLDEMDLSLADLLEKIAYKEVEIIEK